MLDHAVAPFDGLARNHRIAGGVVCRAREEVPLIVAVELKQLGRERVAEIVEDVLARRDVDRKIDPFRGRDLGEAAIEQRLVGRNHLQHDGVTLLEIARDRGDQGRAFHRRQQMIEETLLVGFKCPSALFAPRLGAQARVGGEEDALVERDRRTWRNRDRGTMSER